MIIKAFRENQTLTFLSSFLLALGLWIYTGFHSEVQPDYQSLFNTSLYFLFPELKTISNLRILCSAINIIFLFINGFYISRLAFKYQLLPKRTILPQFMLLIITIPYFTNYNGLSFSLITLTLVLRVLQLLFESLEKQKTSFGYFDSALLISVASIFNFYSIFLIAFLFYVLIQFRGPGFREFIFILLGLALPYVFLIALLYLWEMDINSFLESYSLMFSMSTTFSLNLYFKITLGFTALLIFISSLRMMNDFIKMKIVTRKYSIVFLGLFTTTFLIAIFYPVADKDIIFYVALPLSYLFGHYFSSCKTNLLNQVLLLLLIAGNIALLLLQ